MFAEAAKFFQLENDFKIRCICNQGNLGYTSFQDETLAPHIQSSGDTKEGYYVGREPDIDENQIYVNVWPPYHENLICWKSVMQKYHSDCTQLCWQLIHLISEALDLPSNFFDSYFTRPTALLRLIKYGKILSDPSNGVFGAGAHTDYGMLTLLATNEVSGLQIFLNDKWIPVPPLKDHFIVNLGDCLQIMTRKTFRSTLHRVVIGNDQQDRFSLAFFYEPNRQAVIREIYHTDSSSTSSSLNEPDSTTVTPFEPILYGEYLSKKYEQTHADYKIISIIPSSRLTNSLSGNSL